MVSSVSARLSPCLLTFPKLRDYAVHLAGIKLVVPGLAFQQQDQGVNACATTSLWSALQNIARAEEFHVPTPAEITQAASRYLLSSSVGRSLPSEGLTIQQLCEATRAAGLHPLVLPSTSVEDDRAQIFGYIRSGFAPVLTIRPVLADDGHAVCGVGLKLSDIPPQTDPSARRHHRNLEAGPAEVCANCGEYYLFDTVDRPGDEQGRSRRKERCGSGDSEVRGVGPVAWACPALGRLR